MFDYLLLNKSVAAGTSAALPAVRLQSVHVLGATVEADALDVFFAAALSVVAALRRHAAVRIAATVAAAGEGEAVKAHGTLEEEEKLD